MGTLGSALRALIAGLLGWALILVVLAAAFLLGAEVISSLPHLQRQSPLATPLPVGTPAPDDPILPVHP